MTREARSAVRAARRSDLQVLADLRMRYLGEVAHAEPRLRLLAEARARTTQSLPVWMGQEDRVLLVAEDPQAPRGPEDHLPLVGYAMGLFTVVPPVLRQQHVGEILEVYVAAEVRGRGFGRALVAVLTEALTGRGAEVLRAAVPVAAPLARQRLEAAGYRPLQYVLERRTDSA